MCALGAGSTGGARSFGCEMMLAKADPPSDLEWGESSGGGGETTFVLNPTRMNAVPLLVGTSVWDSFFVMLWMGLARAHAPHVAFLFPIAHGMVALYLTWLTLVRTLNVTRIAVDRTSLVVRRCRSAGDRIPPGEHLARRSAPAGRGPPARHREGGGARGAGADAVWERAGGVRVQAAQCRSPGSPAPRMRGTRARAAGNPRDEAYFNVAVPGARFAERGHGEGRRRRFGRGAGSLRARRRGAGGAPLAAHPRRARRRADSHGERAAGDRSHELRLPALRDPRTGAVPPLPAFGAGHTRGAYSARVASGARTREDAGRPVRARGLAMQAAVPSGTGAMAAVMGVEPAVLAELCTAAAQGEVVSPRQLQRPRADRRRRPRQCRRAPEGGSVSAKGARPSPSRSAPPSTARSLAPAARVIAKQGYGRRHGEANSPLPHHLANVDRQTRTATPRA